MSHELDDTKRLVLQMLYRSGPVGLTAELVAEIVGACSVQAEVRKFQSKEAIDASGIINRLISNCYVDLFGIY